MRQLQCIIDDSVKVPLWMIFVLFIFVSDLANEHQNQVNKECTPGQAKNQYFVTTLLIHYRNILI
jgi:hypothetical protein